MNEGNKKKRKEMEKKKKKTVRQNQFLFYLNRRKIILRKNADIFKFMNEFHFVSRDYIVVCDSFRYTSFIFFIMCDKTEKESESKRRA